MARDGRAALGLRGARVPEECSHGIAVNVNDIYAVMLYICAAPCGAAGGAPREPSARPASARLSSNSKKTKMVIVQSKQRGNIFDGNFDSSRRIEPSYAPIGCEVEHRARTAPPTARHC